MKFITTTFLIALLSLLSGLYLAWWGFAFAAALVTILIPLRAGWAFLSGFAGVFLLWGLLAFLADHNNGHILSNRMAGLLHFGSSYLVILATALIGALIGGFAALTGSLFKGLLKPAEE